MSPRMRTALGGCSFWAASAQGRQLCGATCTTGHHLMLVMRDQNLSACACTDKQ